MVSIEEVIYNANCSDHPLNLEADFDGIQTIFAVGGCYCFPWGRDGKDCGSWCDTGSFGLGQLSDGRYLVVRESSDTSGHGCRCSGSASIHPTLEEALNLGFTDEERATYMRLNG